MTGEDGAPVSGASIIVTGATGGTKTDNEGNFEITIPENKEVILQVSSIGYKAKTVTVTNKSNTTITLEKEVKVAEEVVIVGYGTQKKVNLTGAVSSVDAKQIENRGALLISQPCLPAQAPGLTVVQGGGNPGRNTGVLNIRGIGSFNSTDPLIIVDGIPTGSITDINPQDVVMFRF